MRPTPFACLTLYPFSFFYLQVRHGRLAVFSLLRGFNRPESAYQVSLHTNTLVNGKWTDGSVLSFVEMFATQIEDTRREEWRWWWWWCWLPSAIRQRGPIGKWKWLFSMVICWNGDTFLSERQRRYLPTSRKLPKYRSDGLILNFDALSRHVLALITKLHATRCHFALLMADFQYFVSKEQENFWSTSYWSRTSTSACR